MYTSPYIMPTPVVMSVPRAVDDRGAAVGRDACDRADVATSTRGKQQRVAPWHPCQTRSGRLATLRALGTGQ